MATKLTPSEVRRAQILQLLKQATMPLTGKEIGEQTGVSRQVVVGDINLLKAVDEPIVATSRGYLYMSEKQGTGQVEKLQCVSTHQTKPKKN